MINLIYMISTIFCFIGVLTSFSMDIFLYIGAILNIVEHLLGRLTGELKSLNTLFLSISLGMIFSLFINIPFFTSISFCVCLENIINLIGGFFLVKYLNSKNNTMENKASKSLQKEYQFNLNEDFIQKLDYYNNQINTSLSLLEKIIMSTTANNINTFDMVEELKKNIDNAKNMLDNLKNELPNNEIIVEFFSEFEMASNNALNNIFNIYYSIILNQPINQKQIEDLKHNVTICNIIYNKYYDRLVAYGLLCSIT